MASQLLRIQMSGGGPYGFRLLGGDKNPLTVAKIRPSSKSQVAGLLEGDVILALNNICSQGLSHPAATSLMEGNNPALIVHVLRGINALSEVDSAMSSLGPEVRRLTAEEASALVPNSGPSHTSGNDHVMNGSEPYFRLQAPPTGGNLKQMRMARRESRSSDIQTPDEVATPEKTGGYYAREERTSTDGGKTTRVVEEVKTEKFGGTTLTKVTKEEFSSYKSSSADPRLDSFPTEFSILRSEEQGHPVPLGAVSDGGDQSRDEREWKTTTSVHKSSVRTEPYEVRIDTTQEPTRTYLIYQDGTREELHRPELGRTQQSIQRPEGGRAQQSIQRPEGGRAQQPIPAIEIQFHPNESNFGVETRPSGVGASPNFEIRVGKEVTFQPKVQNSYQATQSHSQLRPILKVQEPSIPSQGGTYSNFSHESNQTNYGTHPQYTHGNEPQSGYLVKQMTRTQPRNESSRDSHYKDDTHPQVVLANDSHPHTRPEVRFGADPDYSYKQSLHHEDVARPHPDIHFRPGTDNPEYGNKPRFGYVSEPQPTVQTHLGYNPEPQSSANPKFGYNSEHKSGTYPQYGYDQEPQTEINSQFEHNYPAQQPRTQYQYGYDKEPQPRIGSQYEYNPEPQPRAQSQHEHNPAQTQPRTQFPHGYHPEPPSKTQPQYGYNNAEEPNTQPKIGHGREPAYPYKPRGYLEYEDNQEHPQSEYSDDSRLYRPAQDHMTNPQHGYGLQQEPQFQTSRPTYNPESKHRAHNEKSYESEQPSVGYNTYPTGATPLNYKGEPQFYDSAPASNTAPAQWGKKLPHGPASHAGPGTYNPPEAVYDTKPSANTREPIIPRQMDRIERVEIGTAPKWTPGSKLPTKLPSKPLQTYTSNPPLTGDPRGPQPGNPVVTGGYYDQAPEGEWYEAPVAEVKDRPNVSFSRVHNPTKHSNETEQDFGYGNAPPSTIKYGGDDHHPRYEREEEHAPIGQYGWSESGGQLNPAGHHPAQGNIWRPSGFGPSAVEEMDRSHGFGAGPAHQLPPPAPPLVPMMGGFGPPQPPVALTPLAPPPPVAPPIDHLKAYRGNTSTDRGYGSTTLEERVKMANSVAHSVLAPENQNSRGQKIFLRRRENSHKWTTHGPDPVPENTAPQEQTRSNTNVWAPKSPGAAQPRPPLPPSALVPQHLSRPTANDYSESNGRSEEPPIGGSKSSYSLADDMAINSGKGGRLFAKRLARADLWASAETTGRQAAPPNIRQGAPQSQVGYGSPAVPPSPGFDSSSYGGMERGKVGGDYGVTNRLQDMIKAKNTTTFGSHQTAPQSPFAQGGQSTGPSLIRVGSIPNLGVYRQVRFQGTSAVSSSPASSPAVQRRNIAQGPRLTPKQFGSRPMVSQSAGYTDL